MVLDQARYGLVQQRQHDLLDPLAPTQHARPCVGQVRNNLSGWQVCRQLDLGRLLGCVVEPDAVHGQTGAADDRNVRGATSHRQQTTHAKQLACPLDELTIHQEGKWLLLPLVNAA
jgi:hypothetical protein